MKQSVKNAEIVYNQNGVVGKRMINHGNFEYMHLQFDIKGETNDHVQDYLMTFFVIKGKAKVLINQVENELDCGEIITIAAGASRQWKNTGDETLELFVIKVASGR